MKRIAIFIAVCLITARLYGQSGNSLSGTVVDSAGNQPVRGASVFFNGTSKGAVSGPDGSFVIRNIRHGNYQLIVSCIGYETFVANIRGDHLPLRIKVILRHESTQLAAAVVEPYMKDGWYRYGQLFMDNFIGTIPNSAKCHLRNKDALRFYLSPKTNRLSVTASEPLIIDNKALGFTLEYRLVRFLYDFDRHLISFTGYPLFHEMTTDRVSVRNKWVDNRRKTYHGSMMHFMRALFDGDSALAREGFSLHRTIQETNQERCRVQTLYNPDSPASRRIRRDSLAYYRSVLNQPAIISRVVDVPDSAVVSVDSSFQVILFFAGQLDISYVDSSVASAGRGSSSSRISPRESFLHLVTPSPVNIDENGAYQPLLELVEGGYWAKSEKIANLLPWDYSTGL